jgi:hypothetical protein
MRGFAKGHQWLALGQRNRVFELTGPINAAWHRRRLQNRPVAVAAYPHRLRCSQGRAFLRRHSRTDKAARNGSRKPNRCLRSGRISWEYNSLPHSKHTLTLSCKVLQHSLHTGAQPVNDDDSKSDVTNLPQGPKGSGVARGALNVVGGFIPFAGGLLSAAASAWSEHEQNKINDFLHHWIQMLAAEMREKEQTILEILARVDMHDEETAKRVESPAYQALMRKAFRQWSGAESEAKRTMVRNLLVNAAGSRVASDDVVKLFLDWLDLYSEFHFEVIGAIYNNAGITRGGVWYRLGRPAVREDSSEADLFRLLFRDLSTGGIVRQHRETDYAGNFIAKRSASRTTGPKGETKTMKSAFDNEEQYELTALGQQFVHYAMTDVPKKLDFDSSL